MKVSFGLLASLLCSSTVLASDAVTDLSEHLGNTPALVVVVCAGDAADLPTITSLVEQTPWTVFCRGAASGELDEIRDWARAEGLLGNRVCVAKDYTWYVVDVTDPHHPVEMSRNPLRKNYVLSKAPLPKHHPSQALLLMRKSVPDYSDTLPVRQNNQVK